MRVRLSNISVSGSEAASTSLTALAAALALGAPGVVLAQSAPAPLDAAPDAPEAPDQPVDIVQCTEDANVFTCTPGTDPDGTGVEPLFGPDGAVINIGEGAFVAGTNAFGAADVAENGTINNQGTVVGDNSGVALNSGGTLNNDGFIQGANFTVDTNVGVTVNNTGTISAPSGVAISGTDNLVVANSGLIQANNGVAIINQGFINGQDTMVTNSSMGSIIAVTDSAILSLGTIAISNDGLIQSFGTSSSAIVIGGEGTVDNTGNIVSEMGGAILIGGVGTITNSETGLIQADGADAIELSGDGSSVTNAGMILATAEDDIAIQGAADLTVSNSGTISAALGTGVEANGDGMILTNEAGGVITGDLGVLSDAGAATIINFGTITGTGGLAVALSDGDDTVQQWQSGVTNGTVDAGDGTDTLIFGNDGDAVSMLSLTDINDPDNFANFESLNFLDAGGGIALSGEGDTAFTLLGGELTIDGDQTATVTLEDGTTLNVGADGSIVTDGTDENAVDAGSDVTVTNDGLISTTGDSAVGITLVDNGIVVNNGTILTTGDSIADAIIGTGSGNSVENNGLIQTDGFDGWAVNLFFNGDAQTLTNNADGQIITNGDISIAVNMSDGATITNDGLIQTNGESSLAIDLDSGTITNNGTIETTGEFSDAINSDDLILDNTGTISSAMAAAISASDATITNSGTISTGSDDDFAVGTPGGSLTLTNEAGGVISAVGEAAVFTFGNNDFVANFGTIASGSDTAVSLADGDDTFQQWTGASVDGDVDLGDGDDTFVLEGTASSLSNGVMGGDGTDTAIIGGLFDDDILDSFEVTTVGTLFDARFGGDRTIESDVTIDGTATFDLGLDSLTVDGDLTLADGSTIVVLTSQDFALVGQGPITVLDETGTFTNNGTTIAIDDDDFLIDYTFDLGSLTVTANAVNPGLDTADPNLAKLGGRIEAGVNAGTIDADNLAALNGIANNGEFEAAAQAALPSLNGAIPREIFEASNAASHVLERHIAEPAGGVWGELTMRGAKQDADRLSSPRYEADHIIAAMGADLAFNERNRFGIMGSYADIEIDDEVGGLPGEASEIEMFKVALYGAMSFGERGFLNAEFGYQFSDVTTARTGLLGPVSSNFDADGLVGRVAMGWDILPDEGVSFTPTIGLNYANVGFDDASEVGGFDFVVEREDVEYLEARAGAQVSADMNGGVAAHLAAFYVHELEGDPLFVRLNSAELGTFTVSTPERSESRFDLGAGVTVGAGRPVSFGVGYQGEFGDGYTSHAASARIRFSF